MQRVTRAALPALRKSGRALIVNISSIMGRIVLPYSATYTATRYAVEGLSESYRYELSGVGVTGSSAQADLFEAIGQKDLLMLKGLD
ncbi:MAG: SDR family NAD(P)-dependent oxidoreductase [Fibrobacteria bacterium]